MIFPPDKFNLFSSPSKNEAFIPMLGTLTARLCSTVNCSFKLLLPSGDGDGTVVLHELKA